MGLLSTAAIIAVVAIIIAGVAFYLFTKAVPAGSLTLGQAEQLVINDIKQQNPTANVTLLPGASNSTLERNSFYIPLSVVYNGSRPCPTLLIETFDYPATGLHPTNDTQASGFASGVCNVYVHGSLPPYPPLFIASSYASNDPAISRYVSDFGYNNVFVMADHELNNTAVGNYTNVWLVRYQAANANYSLIALLDPSGAILQTYNNSLG